MPSPCSLCQLLCCFLLLVFAPTTLRSQTLGLLHPCTGPKRRSRCQPIFPNLKSLRRRQWQPTPVLLPGKSHGQRNLVGCSPWGCEESDMTEWLHIHFSFSCIGEGNGNPLQRSCLENPRDREPGGLPSMGSHRVGYDWSDLAAKALTSNFLHKLFLI